MIAVNVSGLTLCVCSSQLVRLRMQSTQISDHGDGSNYGNASLFSPGVRFLYVCVCLYCSHVANPPCQLNNSLYRIVLWAVYVPAPGCRSRPAPIWTYARTYVRTYVLVYVCCNVLVLEGSFRVSC